MVSAPLSSRPANDLTSHPFHTLTKPRPVFLIKGNHILDLPTTSPSFSSSASLSHFPTKNPPDYPSREPFRTFQPRFLLDPSDGVQTKIMSNYLSRFPRWVQCQTLRLNILPHHPDRVHSEIVQKTPMFRPHLTPSYHPSKIISQYPSYASFTKSHPKNPRPTPTPYHTWAIPGHLENHTGHTLLIFKAGSHFRVQSQVQPCIQLCAGVKKILLSCKITYPFLLIHYSQNPVSVR